MEGQDEQHFMVMVALRMGLGMAVGSNLRATFYPKDLWERVLQMEKIDESKLYSATPDNAVCHAAGCLAEVETTPALISELQVDGGFVVSAIYSGGAAVLFPVPLAGFAEALADISLEAWRRHPSQTHICAAAGGAAAERSWSGMKPIQDSRR